MAVDTSRSSSRRAVLTGAAGALGVFVAQGLGRPLPARAEGQTMVVGGEYPDATSKTQIQNFANDNTVLSAGSNAAGTGVFGGSVSGKAIHGQSQSGYGLYATSSNGDAIYGQSVSGYGVDAYSASGTALHGYTVSGYGLSVHGRATFERSGIATVAAGSDRVSFQLFAGVGVELQSFALATLQTYRSGTHVAAVVKNVAQNRITIRLNKKVTAATKVAWIILD